ncbi:MAG: DUF1571 domain-containing protein [Chitinophagales bacterium]
MNKRSIVIFACAFLALSSFRVADSPARKVVNDMLAAIGKVKGYTYTMQGTERLKSTGNLRTNIIQTKVNVNPLKIYCKILSDPNKGTELLYAKGERGEKVRVNPGKYLPTVSLAATSGLLTKDQHHTVLTSGFNIVSQILNDAVKRSDAQGKFDQVFRLEGEVKFQGKDCYKLVIDDPTYSVTTKTGQAGENLYTFCKRLLISEYSVMELNPEIKNHDNDVSGKTLKVPTSFARKSVLLIDKETNFPVSQEMSDTKGVFEKYEYTNLVLNPMFKADEFTEDFAGYSF